MKKLISLITALLLLVPACGKKKTTTKPPRKQAPSAPITKTKYKEDLGSIKEIGLEEEEQVSMPMKQKEMGLMKEDLDQDGYEAVEVMEEGSGNDDYDLTVIDETETTF